MMRKPTLLSFQSMSLQQKLPLLIGLVLLCIIVLFSYTSYQGVKRAALHSASSRIKTLSEQLSTMFGQSAAPLLKTTQEAAGKDAVVGFLAGTPAQTDTTAQSVLDKLRSDSSWVLAELRDLSGKTLLQSALPGIQINNTVFEKPVGRVAAIGALQVRNDSIYYAVVAPVAINKETIGYLVRWRIQKTNQRAIAQFTALIGDGMRLLVGNADNTVWTDLHHRVAAPVSELSTGKEITYNNTISIATPISGTPWVALVEMSRTKALASAHSYLRMILLTGVALLIVGLIIGWLVSRSITKPLRQLTQASAAVAEGDYETAVITGRSDEIGQLARSFNSMSAKVGTMQHDLENQVKLRTSQLQHSNAELESFSYSVSHDLRAPLRGINGYARILKEDLADRLGSEGLLLADKIIRNAEMMGQLIDDLIDFSKLNSKPLQQHTVNMTELVNYCVQETVPADDKRYKIDVHPLPECKGDMNLLKQVWMNLIGNAVKYSSKKEQPHIEIGYRNGETNCYYVKDNGAGFDMRYADKLFGVFQRLHSNKDFEGTGVGLALTQRIIHRHGGMVKGEGVPGEGATFYFQLPAGIN